MEPRRAIACAALLPDLSGYAQVDPEAFVAADHAGNRRAYFQTPGGLQCAIGPVLGGDAAGCDGTMAATPTGVNEIVLIPAENIRGIRATATPQFVKTIGGAAPVVHDGQKLVYGDLECAVGPGPRTACTKGNPATQWLEISPSQTGVGPATEGLPAGFPDPVDFALDDDNSYIVGAGAKNVFPVFTVDGGLTCQIHVFSGGDVGCDGPLPGAAGGENEVYLNTAGASGIRRTTSRHLTSPCIRVRFDTYPSGTG